MHLSIPQVCQSCLKELYSGTGGPEEWGPKFWGMLEETAEAVPCGHCQPWAVSSIRGLHDVKNSQLGKTIQYPGDLAKLAREAARAAAECHRLGACSGRRVVHEKEA